MKTNQKKNSPFFLLFFVVFVAWVPVVYIKNQIEKWNATRWLSLEMGNSWWLAGYAAAAAVWDFVNVHMSWSLEVRCVGVLDDESQSLLHYCFSHPSLARSTHTHTYTLQTGEVIIAERSPRRRRYVSCVLSTPSCASSTQFSDCSRLESLNNHPHPAIVDAMKRSVFERSR